MFLLAAFEEHAGTCKQEALSWQLWGNDVDVRCASSSKR
jgi:hypothetical protein